MSAAIPIKREIAAASQALVKASSLDYPQFARLLAAMAELMALETGKAVRLHMSAEGDAETLDMVKAAPARH
jgi:hypothetical protein